MGLYTCRYEIANGGTDWVEAESQIKRTAQVKANGGKSMTVSVKSSNPASAKRKGESAADVYAEEIGNREAKKLKKGMRKSK